MTGVKEGKHGSEEKTKTTQKWSILRNTEAC